MENRPLPGLNNLITVMAALRDPKKGCPWDLEQTHDSLMRYFFEEVHEFDEALREKGPRDPRTWEELGDTLFQVVFHAQLLSEQKLTSLDGIAQTMADKLRQRHPHVFDPQHPGYDSAADVNKNWEGMKKKAQPTTSQTPRTDSLRSIPKALPSLLRARRLGEKAASFNFDWDNARAVLDKVEEEVLELKEASQDEAHAQEEFGDVLFALAQYARMRNWDPEALVQKANLKFLGRFESMEKDLGETWENVPRSELEEAWLRAKSASQKPNKV